MIVEFLLDIVKAVLLFLIGLFPELPDMSSIVEFFDPLYQVYMQMNSFISVKLVAGCVLFFFILSNIEFIWGIIMWVVRKIPGEK